MQIGNNTVVSFHYQLSSDGQLLESSAEGQPTLYLHGHDNIINGLEQAMEGKSAGDSLSVTLEPAEAYGLRQEGKEQRVPVKHLIYQGKLQKGMSVHLNTDKGRVAVSVLKVGRHSATVDTNHPLAGKVLTFDVDIVEVREATPEEIAHKHAHGPGGHNH